ncbi:MAG: TRAP transporter small permease subunit [Acidobacteriota bacterium]
MDRLSGVLGTLASWLALLMILVGAFNALARYLGRFTGVDLSSNAYLELQWYLFSLVFLLGGSYALSRDAHVRVDVFYSRLSEKAKAWIDLLGGLLFLLPFTVFGFWVSIPSVRNSFAVREVSPDPGGLWRWPIKAVILVSFALLFLQGVAEVLRNRARVRGGATSDAEEDG